MLKSLWKDPVWSAVIASGLVTTAGVGGTYLLGLWPTIANTAGRSWNFLLTSTAVPNWLLIVIGIAVIPTLLLVVAGSWALFARRSPAQATWAEYTSDKFYGLRWRWRYVSGSIDSLNTFCPHCDYQVFPHNASGFRDIDRIGFKCDSCHRSLGEFDESVRSLESKVERFIQQKVRNETWQTSSGT